MNPLRIERSACLLLVTLMSSVASPGFAQEAPAEDRANILVCAKDFEQAQVQRNAGAYLSATQAALSCSQPKCGQALFTECSKLYAEVQQAVPSVVLSANDNKGNEVPEARVVLDGTINFDQLDGRPINLDPGNHEFHFSAPGMVEVTRRITLLAGEKFRPVGAKFSAAPTANLPAEPTRADSTKRIEPTLARRRIPVMTYVLGGVSLAAAGTFVALQASGSNKYDELKQTCSPQCSSMSVDNLRQQYTISYTALGVSAAALAGALGFYLLQPRTPLGADSALFVGPVPHGASAQLSTRF